MPPWWAVPLVESGLKLAGDAFGFNAGKKLANTAHQREVADMRAAGLNPILSVMGGQGAGMPNVPDFGSVGEEAVSSALQAKRLRGELAQMEASIGLMKDQGHKVDAERQLALEQAALSKVNAELLQTELPAARTRMDFDKTLRGKNSLHIGRFVKNLLKGGGR